MSRSPASRLRSLTFEKAKQLGARLLKSEEAKRPDMQRQDNFVIVLP